MDEKQIVKEVRRLHKKDRAAYLLELQSLKGTLNKWDNIQNELEKTTG